MLWAGFPIFLFFLSFKVKIIPYHYKKAAPPKIAPNTVISKIIPIKEITKPAIDNPFGVLKTPTNEKIKPNNQRIQPKTGTHPRKIAIKARTKPAVPIPLDFFSV